MKVKQFIVITDPDAFMRGDFSSCLNLFDHPCDYGDWVTIREIEIDISGVDTSSMMESVKNTIDGAILKRQGEIEALERRKAELIALPAPDAECKHWNTEYFHAQQEHDDEPSTDEGYRCLDCDEWLGMDDEATRRGI